MTDQSDPKPGGASSQQVAEMERAMDDARQKLAAIFEQQRAARRAMVWAFFAIIVGMLTWGVMTYKAVRQNFSSADLDRVAEQYADDYTDRARAIAEHALREVGPVYRNLAIDKAKAMAPQLRASAEAEIKALPGQIHEDLDQLMESSLERMKAAVEKDMREKFPFVADHDAAEKVFEHLIEQFASQSGQIKHSLDAMIDAEITRTKDVLIKFKLPTLAEHEMAELEKDMLKTALQYAMYELEVSGTDEGLNWEVLRAPQVLSLEPVGDISTLTK